MRPIRFFSLVAMACGVLGASPLWAQNEYPEVEIARGGQFFRGNCAGCHGQDGNLVEGVSLADPRFLQGESGEDLIEIIMNGIPDTSMLESNYSELQAGNIVAYLRSLSVEARPPVSGDPSRGQALVESSGCLNCHRVNGNGSRVGPDLGDIGLRRRTAELEESILEPNATVLPENRYVRVVTSDGTTLNGRLLNHDSVSVQFLDSKERLRSFAKSDLNQFVFVEESPMPSFRTRLSTDELEDLLSYLVSLKGETIR